jgi:hypothetical protein
MSGETNGGRISVIGTNFGNWIETAALDHAGCLVGPGAHEAGPRRFLGNGSHSAVGMCTYIDCNPTRPGPLNRFHTRLPALANIPVVSFWNCVTVIAYLPGCKIAKLEITVQGGFQARTIPCKPPRNLLLHGRMLHLPTSESSGFESEANYLAP